MSPFDNYELFVLSYYQHVQNHDQCGMCSASSSSQNYNIAEPVFLPTTISCTLL